MNLIKCKFFFLILSTFLFSFCACSSIDSEFKECQQEGLCEGILEVGMFPGKLPDSPVDPIWKQNGAIPNLNVLLGPQLITNPQWPNPSTKEVSVRALRSDREIAILLEWTDASNEINASSSDLYTDQAAVMFPLFSGIPPITMGAEGSRVNIWQWKASHQKPLKKPMFLGSNPLSRLQETKQMVHLEKDVQKSPVEDLNAEGFSTLTYQDHQDVRGKGIWSKDQKWHVLMKRILVDDDTNDIQFKRSLPMAIAVWNGANKERNGQKGLSKWILLKFK